MLQTSNSMFSHIYSLVRLIFVAEVQLFTLVLFSPLQVCYTLFSTLNTVLFPSLQFPWVSVTQGPLLSCILTNTWQKGIPTRAVDMCYEGCTIG